MNRREFLTGVVALPLGGCFLGRDGPPASVPAEPGVTLNDVHSQLNPTRVTAVARPRTLDELRDVVRRARRDDRAVSVAGGYHAMGGQQLGEGTLHVDTRQLANVLFLDRETGRVTVEGGIQWPELIEAYLGMQKDDSEPWGIRQKQTGADRFTVAGSLSANGHGRGLTLPPLVSDVESIVLLDARGESLRCSRAENSELFSLAIGGYGLFGIIHTVTLRLSRRRKIERVVELRDTVGLADAFEKRIAEGFLYGDFQFDIDPSSAGFLRRGVFACYRPVPAGTPVTENAQELSIEDWARYLVLTHENKSRAFEEYAAYYLSTSGQVYWTDTHQLSVYPAGYHEAYDARTGARVPGAEMITELYVPRDELAGFLAEAATRLRETAANVIYGTIRWIEKDEETFLPWARESWACTVLNLHVDHDPAGIARAQRDFRLLIDLARKRGGSYFLTYHRWATPEQVVSCYPSLPEFLRLKKAYDPDERFQSDWYRHHRGMLA